MADEFDFGELDAIAPIQQQPEQQETIVQPEIEPVQQEDDFDFGELDAIAPIIDPIDQEVQMGQELDGIIAESSARLDQEDSRSVIQRSMDGVVGSMESYMNDMLGTVTLGMVDDAIEIGGSENIDTESYIPSQAEGEQVVGQIGSSLTWTLGGAALGGPGGAVIGRGIYSGAQGVRSAKSTYEDARRIEMELDGVFGFWDKARAVGAGLVTGVGTTALEYVGSKALAGLFKPLSKVSTNVATKEVGKFAIRHQRMGAVLNTAAQKTNQALQKGLSTKGGKVAVGMVAEGGTESMQTSLEQVATSASTLTNQMDIKEISRATITGTGGGGLAGGLASGIDVAKDKMSGMAEASVDQEIASMQDMDAQTAAELKNIDAQANQANAAVVEEAAAEAEQTDNFPAIMEANQAEADQNMNIGRGALTEAQIGERTTAYTERIQKATTHENESEGEVFGPEELTFEQLQKVTKTDPDLTVFQDKDGNSVVTNVNNRKAQIKSELKQVEADLKRLGKRMSESELIDLKTQELMEARDEFDRLSIQGDLAGARPIAIQMQKLDNEISMLEKVDSEKFQKQTKNLKQKKAQLLKEQQVDIPRKQAVENGEGYILNDANPAIRDSAEQTKRVAADVTQSLRTGKRQSTNISDNVRMNVEPNKKKFWETINTDAEGNRIFSLGLKDKIAKHFSDRFAPVSKAIRLLEAKQGLNPTPLESALGQLRLYAGVGGKVDAAMEHGQADIEGNRVTDYGFMDIVKPLIKDTQAKTNELLEKGVEYLIAERTGELGRRFFRQEAREMLTKTSPQNTDNAKLSKDLRNRLRKRPVSGVGANLIEDHSIAENTIARLEQDPDIDNIKEFAKKYREWAEVNITRLKDAGIISEQTHDDIINSNSAYVAMNRIMQADPDADLEATIKGSSSIAARQELIRTIEGSKKKIMNPLISLQQGTDRSITEADRNVFKKTFVDLLQGGDPLSDSVAVKLNPEDKAGPNTLTLKRDGQIERYELAPDIAKSLKNLHDPVRLPWVATALPKLLRNSITYSPDFAVRNLIRDTVTRLVITNNPGKKNFQKTMDAREAANPLTRDDYQRAGGDQAGWYLRDPVDYYRVQKHAIEDMISAGDKVMTREDIARGARAFKKGYANMIRAGEDVNRVKEFNNAYERGINELGYDEKNARAYAALESRGLIDFAIMGETMQWINQLVPFSNAAIRGLMRSVDAMQSDPKGFTARWSLYVLLPELALQAFHEMSDDEEEYEKLPAYKKDLFWNVKIGDKTMLSIPKPHELGIMSSMVTRGINAVRGQENAFDGFVPQAMRVILPMDEAGLLGPFAGAGQAITNKDLFRDKYIIPRFEEGIPLEDRRSLDQASAIGGALQNTFDALGVDALGEGFENMIDARKIDFMIRNTFGNIGKHVSSFADAVAGKESALDIPMDLSGILKNNSAASNVDVQWVQRNVKRFGTTLGRAQFKPFKEALNAVYDAKSPEEYKEAAATLTKEAAEIRAGIEELGDDYFVDGRETKTSTEPEKKKYNFEQTLDEVNSDVF